MHDSRRRTQVNRGTEQVAQAHVTEAFRNTTLLERYILCLKVGLCLEEDGSIQEAVAWFKEWY